MKKILGAFKKKMVLLIPVIALVIAAALAFLYAFGIFDFTFVKRPSPNDPAETGTAVSTETDAVTDVITEAEPSVTEPLETEPAETEPPVTEPPVIVQPEVEIDPSQFLDAGTAGTQGYYLTSLPFSSDNMIISELRIKLEDYDGIYRLNEEGNPAKVRYWYKPVVEKVTDTSEGKLVWQKTEEPIPILEAYMGYIFADVNDRIVIYNTAGEEVRYSFDPYSFQFSYKRDEFGRPLFHQAYDFTASNKEGTDSVTVTQFDYFYLDTNGYLYQATYNDAVHDRGLYGDYPAYFGATDSNLGRNCIFNRVVRTTIKNFTKLETFIRTRWNYTWNNEPVNENVYYAAYPYSEGLACVTDEEGLMFFINENGDKAFETHKEYDKDFEGSEPRRVVEKLLLPLDESTALGCYYYDHGLVKVRRQIYDYNKLEYYKEMYILSDEYVIIDKYGNDFPIPVGYKVLSYSDGVILLQKNDGTYGYLDYTGAWLNMPEYEDAEPFVEGLAACKKNGRWGVIDTTGKTVIPFMYDYIQSASSGIILCHSENGWNIYLKMAK